MIILIAGYLVWLRSRFENVVPSNGGTEPTPIVSAVTAIPIVEVATVSATPTLRTSPMVTPSARTATDSGGAAR